jgi:serine/threonine protein kinase
MEIGATIDGRYVIKEKIGNETYIVENIISNVRWLLKALPQITDTETIKILQKIRHPSLPRIFEILEIGDAKYYLIEHIEGISLLELTNRNNGKLPYIDACRYMGAVSRILFFLHSQVGETILHMDIKPSNILIAKNNLTCLIDYGNLQKSGVRYSDTDIDNTENDNNNYRIKINDGKDSSCINESNNKSVSPKYDSNASSNCTPHLKNDMFYGTLGYAPPELISGDELSVQSDIFMVGMTLYRIITGLEPEVSLNIDQKSLISTMPAAVSQVIARCVMSQPGDRYSNMSELSCDLEHLCSKALKHNVYSSIEFGTVSLEEDRNVNACTYRENMILDSNRDDKKRNSKKHNEKRKIICIWDNAQFAAEFSYIIARQDKKVLIIDANLLSPGIDMLIDIKDDALKENCRKSVSNLSDLMEEHSKNRLNTDTVKLFAYKTTQDNLNCICGNYRMEDYEYYSTEGLVEIIRTASDYYDFVIVSCGKFIYDEFTCVSLICSDMIIIPITANSINFREYNRFINFLGARKQLHPENVLFVCFDYQPDEDFSYGICDELCNGKFAGVIPYSKRRRMMQGNSKHYTGAMEAKMEKQYMNLLKKLFLLN